MPAVNPYEAPRDAELHVDTRSWGPRETGATLVGAAVVVAAARGNLSVASSLAGIVSGALLLVVGTTVGRIMTVTPRTRWCTLFMAGGFALALTSGWIQHGGGERTLWAFACMCAGLLAGICLRPFPDGPLHDEEEASV